MIQNTNHGYWHLGNNLGRSIRYEGFLSDRSRGWYGARCNLNSLMEFSDTVYSRTNSGNPLRRVIPEWFRYTQAQFEEGFISTQKGERVYQIPEELLEAIKSTPLDFVPCLENIRSGRKVFGVSADPVFALVRERGFQHGDILCVLPQFTPIVDINMQFAKYEIRKRTGIVLQQISEGISLGKTMITWFNKISYHYGHRQVPPILADHLIRAYFGTESLEF